MREKEVKKIRTEDKIEAIFDTDRQISSVLHNIATEYIRDKNSVDSQYLTIMKRNLNGMIDKMFGYLNKEETEESENREVQ